MVKISVIMPTYNTEIQMLQEAVNSILNQTFQDFEFIIINDGSTNGTGAYLKSIRDKRIKIIHNQKNIGITKSLNIGLENANGQYIARMDADDISLPTRFERQYLFMESHPDVVMCGATVQNFAANNKSHITRINDMDYYRIKTLFYYPGPVHPTMFIRHQTLLEHKIAYDESLAYAQDYDLCEKISITGGKIVILPEILLHRRVHTSRITNKYYEKQKQCSIVTQKRLLLELLGSVTDDELALHYRFSYEKVFHSLSDFSKCLTWYLKLINANNHVRKYPRKKFAFFAMKLLMLITIQNTVIKAGHTFRSKRKSTRQTTSSK